jgi:hypothetical protein
MKSILKTCFMLFRNVIMWALLFAWLIKGVAGAGHVLSAYVIGVALLVLLALCFPVKPEGALKASLAGKFWRGAEVVSQYFILIGLIWFTHYVIAVAWLVACLGLSLMRLRILEAKKKAQKEWMDRDAAAIMSAFAGMNQQSPPAQTA